MKSLKVKKLLALMLASAMAITMVTGCTSSDSDDKTSSKADDKTSSSADANTSSKAEDVKLEGQFNAGGSSALKPLADIAVEKFGELHEDVIITIEAGGSGTGLKGVSDGTFDIGNSDLFAEEKLSAEQAAELVDHRVCTVTMAPIVNPELGVTELTTEQLIQIFTGEVKNWKEVGGPDLEILLCVRPEGSGTKATFQEYALDGNAEVVDSEASDNSGELVGKIQNNKGAIGYVAMSYFTDDVQTIAIDGVEPTLENTYNGTYNVWSYEHMYTKGEAEGAVKAFIDYMMGEDFAPEIEKAGYGVASKLSETAIANHEPKDAE